MEHSLFLRQYKYEIPSLVNARPALSAFFDFENGDFLLEGDYKYVLNGENDTRKKRFLVNAEMKPEIPAGPDDNLSTELLVHLKGFLYNGERQSMCSGLLRLNRNLKGNKMQWMIYCNLVDNDMDVFEIRLKLPVITSLVQAPGEN